MPSLMEHGMPKANDEDTFKGIRCSLPIRKPHATCGESHYYSLDSPKSASLQGYLWFIEYKRGFI